MPLNRVNQVKAMSFWLMVLNATKESQDMDSEPVESADQPDVSNTENSSWTKQLSIMLFGTKQKITRYDINAKHWIPGMLVVTMPEAGILLGFLDIGYWAGFLYVLGSVFYVIDSFFLMSYVVAPSDDAFSPAVFLNFIATWIFVVNALVCFLDWHMQIKQLSVMNIDTDNELTGGFEINEINHNITWCYFFNNLFFLAAAVIYLMQGLWMESPSLDIRHCSIGL
jgi:hypothetical protein